MIDLHTHTTASDGRSAPTDLVARAAAAGVRVLSVTDHDTVGGLAAAEAAAVAAGVEFVPGIEVTAVVGDADVHVLGYFIDAGSASLQAFLLAQRASRTDRLRQIVERLGAHGIALDIDAILQPSVDDPGKSPGRPWIARALVAGRHVPTPDEAFRRWLGRGRPAFVPRLGAPPADVFAHIHQAGGLASLAHPVLVDHDEWIPEFAGAGLDAIEAYHSEQNGRASRHYVEMAARLGLLVTGGSDYHGDGVHGVRAPGAVSLPRRDYDRLILRHRRVE